MALAARALAEPPWDLAADRGMFYPCRLGLLQLPLLPAFPVSPPGSLRVYREDQPCQPLLSRITSEDAMCLFPGTASVPTHPSCAGPKGGRSRWCYLPVSATLAPPTGRLTVFPILHGACLASTLTERLRQVLKRTLGPSLGTCVPWWLSRCSLRW